MKILFALDKFPSFAGIETVTRTLANAFVARGHQVHIVAFREVHSSDVFIDSRVKTVFFPGKYDEASLTCQENVSFLESLIRTSEIDFVICQDQSPEINILCNEAKRSGLAFKVLSCVHFAPMDRVYHPEKPIRDLMSFQVLHSYAVKKKWILDTLCSFLVTIGLLKIRERIRLFSSLARLNWIYDCSDRLVFLSDSFVDLYRNAAPKKDIDRCVAISNPLPQAIDWANSSLEGKENILLFVGRIDEAQKRLSLIIEAWRRISQLKQKNGWKLFIVGDGPDMEAVKAFAHDLTDLTFEGYKNSQPYYRKAKIFLMSSSTEGFGMTLIESQALGCVPVVMDSFSAVYDVIDNECNGLIVPNDDVNAFVAAILDLMNDGERLEKMATSAISNCKRFDSNAIAEKWERLFEELQG